MTEKYIPKVIFSVLLSFSLIGLFGLIFLQCFVFSPYAFKNNAASADVILEKIETDAKEYTHTSGLDSKVITGALTKDDIKDLRNEAVIEGVKSFKTGKFDFIQNFKNEKLESSVTKYFEDYAKENDVNTESSEYKEALDTAIKNSENIVSNAVDVYKFSYIAKYSIASKLAKISKLLAAGIAAAVILSAVFAYLIIIVSKKKDFLYWLASSLFAASGIYFILSLVFKISEAVKKFAIKDPPVFESVQNLANSMINTVMIVSAIFFVLSIVCIAVKSVKISKAK